MEINRWRCIYYEDKERAREKEKVRERDKEIGREGVREGEKKDQHTGRQTDRQTDLHTGQDRTDRQKESERERGLQFRILINKLSIFLSPRSRIISIIYKTSNL